MQGISFRAMGSNINILLDNEALAAQAALQQAKHYFKYCEQSLSRFSSESELSQLNQKGYGHVSPILWKILEQALQLAKKSQGLVTPTVLPALIQAGYHHSFNQMQFMTSKKPIHFKNLRGSINQWGKIIMHPDKRYVDLQGNQLDFGGIAKGWCAEEVCHSLSKFGAALVDAGGDIASYGIPKSQKAWVINLDPPYSYPSKQRLFTLSHQAVATSGVDYRNWLYNGKKQNHIIDPRTLLPVQSDIISATVIASDAISAEAACKTVLILGSQEVKKWLTSQNNLHACWFLHDGTIDYTNYFPWLEHDE